MNNSSSTDSEAKHNNKGFEASEFTYIVTFVFGILFLVLSVVVACVRLRVSRGGGGGGSTHNNILAILTGIPSRDQDDDEIMEEGLRHRTDTSFEGYPKLLYSQVIHQHKGEGESGSISLCSSNTSCSICLGDYKESDTLRLLPGCGHLYHLACVDPWLRLHSTCPICRKSPLQTQTSSHTTNTTTSTLSLPT